MNTQPPHGYRRIYPNASLGAQDQQHDASQTHAGRGDSSKRQPTGALPAIHLTNPYESSRDSGAGDDSRHIHYHHYHAYFLPPAPVPHQPSVAAGIVRAFDER